MTRLFKCCWIAAATLVQLQLTCADAATPARAATADTAATPAPAATPAATPPTPPGESLQRSLTLQELMDTRIDPAADVLWDSVAFIATAKGEEDRRPRTPAEWDAVRQSALALIEAVDELATPGRRVASAEKAPGPGELPASAIQRRIDANPDAFARHARVLKSATQKALSAIDAKNADALMTAGGLIDEACEACHVVYWYPHQAQSPR
jgi:cytochrome c556